MLHLPKTQDPGGANRHVEDIFMSGLFGSVHMSIQLEVSVQSPWHILL